jgi:hypothetical protein
MTLNKMVQPSTRRQQEDRREAAGYQKGKIVGR